MKKDNFCFKHINSLQSPLAKPFSRKVDFFPLGREKETSGMKVSESNDRIKHQGKIA
jgi:hypothetical protein